MTTHPVTLYGFILAAMTLVGLIVLIALGDVSSDVGVPVIVALAGVGAGAGAGVAAPQPTPPATGTVTLADPNA